MDVAIVQQVNLIWFVLVLLMKLKVSSVKVHKLGLVKRRHDTRILRKDLAVRGSNNTGIKPTGSFNMLD